MRTDSKKKTIKSLWIESEQKGAIVGGQPIDDDNSDVIVTFDDDSSYVATFFTYANLETLRQKNSQTGECLNGKYFWASNMVIVDTFSRESIHQVINHLIETGEFFQVFKLQ